MPSRDIQPGDEVVVRGTLVGSECSQPVRCLLVRVDEDEVWLRTRRFPTKAEVERGGYDPWTKRVRRVPRKDVSPISHRPDAPGGTEAPMDDKQREEIKQAIVAALQRRRDRRVDGEQPRPLPAIVIARRFGIRPHGGRDSRRRGVRLLIKELRADGVPILMDGHGYYLGTTTDDYQAAQTYARRNGLGQLALAAAIKRSPEAADASGQLSMFD